MEIYCTRFGDMPRATAAPPIVYSSIKAQPINQATLHKTTVHSPKSPTEGMSKVFFVFISRLSGEECSFYINHIIEILEVNNSRRPLPEIN